MKLELSVKKLILVFICLNGLIVSALIYLLAYSAQYKLLSFTNSENTYTLSNLPPEVSSELTLTSKAFIIYDPLTRNILAGKNEKLRFAPASTVKIMTALIALENYDLEQVLTVKNIDVVKGSKMNLVEDEKITVKNLLYGMMLPSGNDAAYVLAQNYPGGLSEFVNAMNKKANDLNLTNTKFVDSAGLDDKNYTTAFDLARIASYAMENKTLAKIVATKYMVVTDTKGEIVHNLTNLNELLGTEGVNGIKTGYTEEAGGVLTTSVNSKGRNFIIVVLASDDRFGDTVNVIEEAVVKIHTLSY